jgi:hypothetical protein
MKHPQRSDLLSGPDGETRNRLRALLPLWDEKVDLPSEFMLDVPYYSQSQQHYSGAACIQMVSAFHGRPHKSQDDIMADLGVKDFRDIKHESFEVLLSDFLARNTKLLPAHYSPAIHIAPKMGDGVAATDFIRGYPQTIYIAEHDFYVFKRILTVRQAPLVARIHFTTEKYPMTEDIAQYLDITGHCLLITEYNGDGFFVHDPWDKAKFGGARGGPNCLISYAEIRDVAPLVNCSKDDIGFADQLGVYFEHLPKAVFPNRDIDGRLVLYWPGIEGVAAKRWYIKEVAARFYGAGAIKFQSSTVSMDDFELRPGQTRYVPYTLNTGDRLGSFQVSVEIKARLICPTFAWVIGHQSVDEVIDAQASYRISVQDIDWFRKYATP